MKINCHVLQKAMARFSYMIWFMISKKINHEVRVRDMIGTYSHWQTSLVWSKYSRGVRAYLQPQENFAIFTLIQAWKQYFQHLNWHKIFIQIWALFFLENWQFNHKLGPPLYFTKIMGPKDYPHNLRKYKIKGTSKIPIFQLSNFPVNWKKIWKCNLGLFKTKSIFFHELGKIEKSR